MKKLGRLLFILLISFNISHAYSALEDLLLSKVHSVDGTFGEYDFQNAESKFDWAFTTSEGQSYQLLGKAASDSNAFGWAAANIVVPKAVWSMFSLDIDGDGSIGKFEWILASTDSQAIYKLKGTSDNGSFDYSEPILLNYTITQNSISFSVTSEATPPNENLVIDTPTKAMSVAKTMMNLISTTSSLTKSLSNLATLGASAPLRASLRIPTTQNCSTSGTMTTDLDYAELSAGVLNISVSYNDCVEGVVTTNGTLSLSGNIDLANFQVSNLIAILDDFSVSIDGDISVMNGTIAIATASATQLDMVLNATVDATIDGKSAKFEYNNYSIVVSGNSIEINGNVLVDYTPDSCVDGTYIVETISPLITNSAGEIISGSIKVNDQLFTFNADGTLSTTINGENITIEASQEIEFCN